LRAWREVTAVTAGFITLVAWLIFCKDRDQLRPQSSYRIWDYLCWMCFEAVLYFKSRIITGTNFQILLIVVLCINLKIH